MFYQTVNQTNTVHTTLNKSAYIQMLLSCGAEKQAVCDEQVSYLHVAPCYEIDKRFK